MRKSLFWMAVVGALSLSAAWAVEPRPGPPSDHAAAAAAQEKAAQDLAACAPGWRAASCLVR
jgi:hypothetical protein